MPETPPRCGSLIAMGLRNAFTGKGRQVEMVEFRGLDPKLKHTNITSVHELITLAYDNDLPQAPILPAKPPVITRKDSPMTIRQKWGYADPEIIPPKPKFSHILEHTTIHKGFGRFILQRESKNFEDHLPSYPPLPNAAYDFLNKNLSTTPSSKPSLDGATLVKSYILLQNAEDERLVREGSTSLGELIAEKMDWSLKLYNGGELGTLGTPSVCIAPWRRDLVTAIDNAKELGQEPFEMCNKCQKRHIPWGPPVALQDRDTCLSMLPEWFPIEDFDKPWHAFIDYINKAVRFEERDQGRILNPDRRAWDKEFHEPTEDWKAVGRHGGWWKCRTSNGEGEATVSTVESNCRLCHRAKTEEEEAAQMRITNDAAEKVRIRLWIEKCMKNQMKKDKAVVLARIRHGLE